MTPLVRCVGLSKTYRTGPQQIHAVIDVNRAFYPGTLVALAGPSGSGKSTLLGLLAGYDTPDQGHLDWAPGVDPQAWTCVSVVPQSLGLAGDRTLAENVELALRLAGHKRGGQDRGSSSLLAQDLGLTQVLGRYPAQVSLGAQQRLAVLRAACTAPRVMLLDEPTAHQDIPNAQRLHRLFRRMAEAGTCVIATTHSAELMQQADVRLDMHDGQLLVSR